MFCTVERILLTLFARVINILYLILFFFFIVTFRYFFCVFLFVHRNPNRVEEKCKGYVKPYLGHPRIFLERIAWILVFSLQRTAWVLVSSPWERRRCGLRAIIHYDKMHEMFALIIKNEVKKQLKMMRLGVQLNMLRLTCFLAYLLTSAGWLQENHY